MQKNMLLKNKNIFNVFKKFSLQKKKKIQNYLDYIN